ncbi:hypothetical protein EMIT0P253_30275 [Pseudomonas sp. IT-P253]
MRDVMPWALLAFWLWPTGWKLCVIYDEWFFSSAARNAGPVTSYGSTVERLQVCGDAGRALRTRSRASLAPTGILDQL